MSQSFRKLEKVREVYERNRLVVEMESGVGTIGEVLGRQSRKEVREARLTRELKRGISPVMEAKERARKENGN